MAELYAITRFLAETPEVVRQLTAELTETDLKQKPSAKEFSILEHVCHLRDIEREGYSFRIKSILMENNPPLPDIDGDRLAIERDYNNQDFLEAFEGFQKARRANLMLLNNLSAEQLQRTGTFENVGAITLEKLLAMMLAHDEDHRQGLSELREKAINI